MAFATRVILNLHGRAGIGDDNLSSLRPWSATFADPEWRAAYSLFRGHAAILVILVGIQ